ncbi:MAG: hypothetical protein M3N29_09010 [Chloroflexota bacterium]|nr:hypothetical protein [Chloroflexota bacterium]
MSTAEQILDRFTPGRLVEQEIRDAIEARLDRRVGDADRMASVRQLIRQSITQGAADPLIDSAADTLEGRGEVWEPLDEPHRWALFSDLRPSEAAGLVELVAAACDRAEERCIAAIVEELTEAGAQFLREHPNARLRGEARTR